MISVEVEARNVFGLFGGDLLVALVCLSESSGNRTGETGSTGGNYLQDGNVGEEMEKILFMY